MTSPGAPLPWSPHGPWSRPPQYRRPSGLAVHPRVPAPMRARVITEAALAEWVRSCRDTQSAVTVQDFALLHEIVAAHITGALTEGEVTREVSSDG